MNLRNHLRDLRKARKAVEAAQEKNKKLFVKGPAREAKRPEGLKADRVFRFEDCLNIFIPRVEQVPSSAFNNGRSFIYFLIKKGFKTMGSGYFSTVLHKKGERVIKVGHRINQDGWADYMLWGAKKGYAGKFIPKVYSYKRIKGKKEDFYVASMEKLESTFTYEPETDHSLLIMLAEYQLSYKNKTAGLLIDLVHPGIGRFTSDLAEYSKGKRIDLHHGNWMHRGDGTIAIIDAVAYGTACQHKRLRAGDFESLAMAIN